MLGRFNDVKENYQGQGGRKHKSNYYHSEMDYFPIVACPKVLYSISNAAIVHLLK